MSYWLLHYDLVPQGFGFQSADPDSSDSFVASTIDVVSKTFDNLYQSYTSCVHEHNGHIE